MNKVKKKICVVITARPSYSRVKTLLKAIERNKKLDLQLVVAASALLEKYGSVIDTIKSDGFTPNALVYSVIDGNNLRTSVKSTGIAMMELSTVFRNLNPDVVVTIADRYETIATAITASFLNIPLAHIQGGEVTGSIDDKVRHAVTKLSDVHFVSNENALQRVIKMGENPKSVINTGCPSVDIAEMVRANTLRKFDPFLKYKGTGNKFNISEGYYVVMQHPVTTSYKDSFSQISETLKAIKKISAPIIMFWPNLDAGADEISKRIRLFQNEVISENLKIYFYKNLEPEDFLRLIIGCNCLIGNSSVGIREASYLGIPTVNIGDRQLGRERAENVIDVDYNSNSILKAISHQTKIKRYKSSTLYGDGEAGQKISNYLSKYQIDFNKKISY